MRPARLSSLLGAALGLLVSLEASAALTLDTTFDGDGLAFVDLDAALDSARAVAVQSDGKIVMAGLSRVGSLSNSLDYAAVVRLNANGSVDTGFGTAGKISLLGGTPATFGGSDARAVALDAGTGNIVIAGAYNPNGGGGQFGNRLLVARITPSGALDSTFGTGGVVTLDLSTVIGTASGARADAVAVQSDGKIVVAGLMEVAGNYSRGLIGRFNANGSLDTSFGTSGFYTLAAGATDHAYFRDLVLLPAGGLLAGGSNGDLVLVKLDASGAPVAGFGTAGVASRNVSTITTAGVSRGSTDSIEALALLSDGRIAVSGSTESGTGSGNNLDAIVARFSASGAFDAAFGTAGLYRSPDTANGQTAYALVAAGGDELVFAGLGISPTQLSVDGARQDVLATATGVQAFLQLALQPNGAVVGAGEANVSGANYQFAAMRLGVSLLGNGPDTTPDAFSFAPQSGVAFATVVTSAAVTIAGIDSPAPISVSGGSYSVGCTSTFTTTAGTISAGQTVCVRHTSSASPLTAVSTTLTIGGVAASFSSTTQATPPDTTPDAFSFTAQQDVARSTQVTSATVTIAGINAAAPVTVSGGEYSIGCTGTFTNAAGTLTSGQTVCVRHTSSSQSGTAVSTVLSVGGVTATFTSTTARKSDGFMGIGAVDPFIAVVLALLVLARAWGLRRRLAGCH